MTIGEHAQYIARHHGERGEYFRKLSGAEQMAVFDELSAYVQRDILAKLSLVDVVALLDQHDPGRAEKLIMRIPNASRRRAITLRLKRESKEKIDIVRSFHAQATIEIVDQHYVLVPETATVADVAEALDAHFDETGRIPVVLVHRAGKCIGEVRPGDLVREETSSSIAPHVRAVAMMPYTHAPREIAARCVEKKVHKVVIVDTDESVLGIVFAREVNALFEELPSESLYEFAAIEENEHAFDSVKKKFNADTLKEMTILAMYLPIVAGMGGNAGIQSMAIFMRSITLGEITLARAFPAVRREIMASVLQGTLNGVITGTVAVIFGQTAMFGVVVGLGVLINLIVAATFGSLIPLAIRATGRDPAIFSGIILTTFTDICGFLAIFLLAIALL
jgi:magnesium transporter